MASRGRRAAGNDPNQLQIDWRPASPPAAPAAKTALPSIPPPPDPAESPLLQVLPRDFRTSFPQPTDEAIDGGVLDESDRQPDNLKALH